MSAVNSADVYDAIGPYIVEMYDQAENQRDDVDLILSLLGDAKKRILEPFCGHGRVLLSLAEAGHEVLGMDHSKEMLICLASRREDLSSEVRSRVSFQRADVLAEPWPVGFDVVILGGNCLYELATPEEQEFCVAEAARSLVSGGWLYLDNDHMEGALPASWTQPRVHENVFPTGVCRDGTRIQGKMETAWHDADRRMARFRRTATLTFPDGRVEQRVWMQQKHAPSTEEMKGWLASHGFRIASLWGDRRRETYHPSADRAVFWACKP